MECPENHFAIQNRHTPAEPAIPLPILPREAGGVSPGQKTIYQFPAAICLFKNVLGHQLYGRYALARCHEGNVEMSSDIRQLPRKNLIKSTRICYVVKLVEWENMLFLNYSSAVQILHLFDFFVLSMNLKNLLVLYGSSKVNAEITNRPPNAVLQA